MVGLSVFIPKPAVHSTWGVSRQLDLSAAQFTAAIAAFIVLALWSRYCLTPHLQTVHFWLVGTWRFSDFPWHVLVGSTFRWHLGLSLAPDWPFDKWTLICSCSDFFRSLIHLKGKLQLVTLPGWVSAICWNDTFSMWLNTRSGHPSFQQALLQSIDLITK